VNAAIHKKQLYAGKPFPLLPGCWFQQEQQAPKFLKDAAGELPE